MGYMVHHALIITSWKHEDVYAFRGLVLEMLSEYAKPNNLDPKMISPIFVGINTEASFIIFPDGSKEGWPHSDNAEDLRKRVIDLLKAGEHIKFADWCYIAFGGDYHVAKIEAHSGEGYSEV